jgi:hypothetical protein
LTGFFVDPSHGKLLETRTSVLHAWRNIADALDRQGELALAVDVRQFARHLPPVRTDNEKLAERYVEFLQGRSNDSEQRPKRLDDRTR